VTNERESLTERELEILRLVATGASNEQIARQLVISVNTVKVHLRNIFTKLEVQSRTEATLFAIREGWIQGVQLPETPLAEEVAEQPVPARPRTGWRSGIAIVAMSMLVILLISQSNPGSPSVSTPSPTATVSATTNSSLQRWKARAPLPVPRRGLGLVAYGGQVYALGGESAAGVVGSVERYDPQTDGWTSLADKPHAVADIAAALVGDQIYVPGGRTPSGSPTAVVEVYSPETDTWENKAPLPTALSGYALVALEGKLYLFGGWDGSTYVDSVYEYDPAEDAWTPKTPMPTARAFAGAAVVDGKIYVIGGYDGQNDLTANEEYVPSRDDSRGDPWTTMPPMPVGRAGCGVAAAANIVHIVGGGWDTAVAGGAMYNVRSGEWVAFEVPVSGQWRSVGLALLDTEIYAIGGWNGDYMDVNEEYKAIYTIIVPVPI
jgi:DNA-binding CsgD family transcriptional regulator